jgi:hypothetical protein
LLHDIPCPEWISIRICSLVLSIFYSHGFIGVLTEVAWTLSSVQGTWILFDRRELRWWVPSMKLCFVCINNCFSKTWQNFDGTPIWLGHYVPQLAQAIKRHHEATGDKSINLKGYMVCFW